MKAFIVGGYWHGALKELNYLPNIIEVPLPLVNDDNELYAEVELYEKETIQFGGEQGKITFYFHPDIPDDDRTAKAFSAIAKWLQDE